MLPWWESLWTMKSLMKPSAFRTSASLIFTVLQGISTFSWWADEPLRRRVNMSLIGSLMVMLDLLPARFDDARHLALEGAGAETDAAHLELAQEGAGTAAQGAAVVVAHLELLLPLCLGDL